LPPPCTVESQNVFSLKGATDLSPGTSNSPWTHLGAPTPDPGYKLALCQSHPDKSRGLYARHEPPPPTIITRKLTPMARCSATLQCSVARHTSRRRTAGSSVSRTTRCPARPSRCAVTRPASRGRSPASQITRGRCRRRRRPSTVLPRRPPRSVRTCCF